MNEFGNQIGSVCLGATAADLHCPAENGCPRRANLEGGLLGCRARPTQAALAAKLWVVMYPKRSFRKAGHASQAENA